LERGVLRLKKKSEKRRDRKNRYVNEVIKVEKMSWKK